MTEVVIIGAGLAGLSCALSLQDASVPVTLLEASDAPGGRVRTDMVEGFRLDRGFQVMLTAYPEARRLLDYTGLQLKKFEPGALVWQGGKFHRFADPFRDPSAAVRFLFDPIVSWKDKLQVAKLRARVQQGTLEEMFTRPEKTTRDYLQSSSVQRRDHRAVLRAFLRRRFSGARTGDLEPLLRISLSYVRGRGHGGSGRRYATDTVSIGGEAAGGYPGDRCAGE